jgi:hypothetical protein
MADDGGGNLYGAFASKLGSGAAKAGKKFAQSEAGRSATRAAVKGATEAATKDLTDRYLGPAQPAPVKPKPPTSSSSTSTSTSITPPSTIPPTPTATLRDGDSDDDEEKSVDTYISSRPPAKPSILNRFKPSIKLKTDKSAKKLPTKKRSTSSRRNIYQPDWNNLPQAITLYNFHAEMKCDLEFRKNQIIQIITRSDTQDDWWEGKLDDRVGIFPANYVKLL